MDIGLCGPDGGLGLVYSCFFGSLVPGVTVTAWQPTEENPATLLVEVE
jgi:hypothetical protein